MNPVDQTDYSKPVAYDMNGRPLYAHPPVMSQQPQTEQPGYVAPITTTPAQPVDFSSYPTPNTASPYTAAQSTVTPMPTPAPAPTPVQSPFAVPAAASVAPPVSPYDSYPSPVAAAPSPVPSAQPLTSDTEIRHNESIRKYPSLNLSADEYVISEVNRHPAGLIGAAAASTVLVLLVIGFLLAYPAIFPSGNPPFESLLMPAFLLLALIGILTYIVVWTYQNNRFYLTNEAIIQEIQTSLFGHREQSVSLGNVEDASYVQSGIREMMFNYGSIRLSTQGDETTYRFTYVANPKDEITVLNNAVESYKNGRPVA